MPKTRERQLQGSHARYASASGSQLAADLVPASDDLQHYGRGVDLVALPCLHCDSDPIAPLAGFAIVS